MAVKDMLDSEPANEQKPAKSAISKERNTGLPEGENHVTGAIPSKQITS